MNFSDKILQFLFSLKFPYPLPENVGVLDVHKNEAVQEACHLFYNKFYGDHRQRHVLLGINPGRFGGGVTGIPFTDPVHLAKDCGITNSWPQKQELSAIFMYEMMHAYGGVKLFYEHFYFSAISPLGFVKNGKNLNYYDDPVLKKQIEPFVVDCINKQLAFGLDTDVCFCIGEGENLKYLKLLNENYNWFQQIVALPHPRFIMQYKRKQKDAYIQAYVEKLGNGRRNA